MVLVKALYAAGCGAAMLVRRTTYSIFCAIVARIQTSFFHRAPLCLMLALFGFGGSTFDRDWTSALATPAPDLFAGPWVGTWKSMGGGHSGPLRCVVTETGPLQYRARFRAGYWKIFHFEYTLPMTARREGSVLKLEGEQNIGRFCGGVYKYTGTVTSDTFTLGYGAQNKDYGAFELKRPKRTQ
jgi:hypothetical protein